MSKQITYIQIPVHRDDRGELLPIEEGTIPFTPKRIFYLFGVPENASRAGHAVDSDIFILPLKGSVIVENSEGKGWELSDHQQGLHVPAMNFITLKNFSADAIVVIYASKKYVDTNYYSLDDLKGPS